jgi:hypothetical protein
MGLALDEHADSENYITQHDIKISFDGRLREYYSQGVDLHIEFRETAYGSGFVINGGSAC